MAGMQIPESWDAAAKSIVEASGIALVVGKVNAGKSTLTRYLLRVGSDRGLRTAVVDADLGQSNFGPPACLSLAFLSSSASVSSIALRFVGATSPAGHLLQVTVGVKLLVERARAGGADLVIVDTSGMIQGPHGTLLKRHKIELVCPDHLLILQKGGELEGFLGRLPCPSEMKVHRLSISTEARVRSAAERSAHRQKQFAAYFEDAGARTIHLSRPHRIVLGPRPAVGRLIGLLDAAGDTVGLGRIRHADAGRIGLITPVNSFDSVRFLQTGSVRLKEDWSEMG
jgi:polynucleotide 5'-hydroxyl-kinase GRC3/NOL9